MKNFVIAERISLKCAYFLLNSGINTWLKHISLQISAKTEETEDSLNTWKFSQDDQKDSS